MSEDSTLQTCEWRIKTFFENRGGGEGRGGRDEGGPKEERCTKTLKNVLNCDLPLLI